MKAALRLTGLLAPWALSAALAAALRASPRLAARLTAAAGAVSFGAAAAIWIAALEGEVLVAGPEALFRADALSALVACCIAAVSGLAMLPWAGTGKQSVERVVVAAAFSPDGSLLAAGEGDGRILIHDTATGKVVGELPGHPAPATRLAFTPDGRRLVSTCSADLTSLVWDLAGLRR